MNSEGQIKLIADDVNNCFPIAMPKQGDRQGFFVAIAANIAEATYTGRKEQFSILKFRKHMIMAAKYCLLASGSAPKLVEDERLRQDRIWGDEFDRKNTANDWHSYVIHYISRALLPETDYAAEMVKACGICQAAALMVDRFGAPSPRHYEDLPGAGGMCPSCGNPDGKDHVCPTNTTVVNNVMLDKPKEEI